MGNYFAYMRISTDAEKQNFNRQVKALKRYEEDQKIKYLLEFKEEKSAKNFEDREQFKKLDALLNKGDTVVFKDITRFSRDAQSGYNKYAEWIERGVNIVFLDNPTVSSEYILQMMQTAKQLDLVSRTALEGTIKLLIIVELDRAQKQREYISKTIRQGIEASDKKSGRPEGKLDKMTDELRSDIEKFLQDRTIKQVDLMKKHGISRNTLKKYIALVQAKQNR